MLNMNSNKTTEQEECGRTSYRNVFSLQKSGQILADIEIVIMPLPEPASLFGQNQSIQKIPIRRLVEKVEKNRGVWTGRTSLEFLARLVVSPPPSGLEQGGGGRIQGFPWSFTY